jgi:hypothetical protein
VLSRNSLTFLGGLPTSRIAYILSFIIALNVIVLLLLTLPPQSNQNDFAHYYVSSRLLVDGQNPYRADFSEIYPKYGFEYDWRIYQATNPPLLIYLFAPLALLPPLPAFWIWIAVQALSFMALLWLVRILLRERLSLPAWCLMAALSLGSMPVVSNFTYSQVQILLAAMVLGAYALQRSGWRLAPLLLVTLAGLLKIFPLALIPWFVYHASSRWSRRALFAAIPVITAGIVIGLTGPELWVDFFRNGGKVVSQFILQRTFNYSVPSLLINISYLACGFKPAAHTATLIFWAGMASGLAIIIFSYANILVAKPDQDIQFSVLCISMIMGGLTAWGHYLVFLIFPLAVAYLKVVDRQLSIILYGIVVVQLGLVGTETLLLVNSLISILPIIAMSLLWYSLMKK